nr:SCO family protein [Metabacillus lacus]
MVFASAFLLTGCGAGGLKDSLNYQVESFRYNDQSGSAVQLSDLKGKIWVANFIFTSCETVCPPMTANMARLQKLAAENQLDVQFVSFSVDPVVDSPEVLKTYGEKFGANFDNWVFLTGYQQKEIEDFARKSFKTIVKKPEAEDQVIHGTSLYLIDTNGKVMKSYSGVENTPYEEIVSDMKLLHK